MKLNNIIKNTTLITILATTANAQSTNPFFSTLSGGYFFDQEAPYVTLDIGSEISPNNLLSLQILHSQRDNDNFLPISLEEQYTGFGLNFKKNHFLGGNIELFYTAGAGIALIDLEASSGGEKISEDTTTPYITLSVGVQEQFNANWKGHIALRALWLDNFSVDRTIGGTTYSVSGPEHDINFGLEIGFTYTF